MARMVTVSIASGCLSLCETIIEHLCTADANEQEFKSLLVAVQGIKGFLSGLPTDGITVQGYTVLGRSWAAMQVYMDA